MSSLLCCTYLKIYGFGPNRADSDVKPKGLLGGLDGGLLDALGVNVSP